MMRIKLLLIVAFACFFFSCEGKKPSSGGKAGIQDERVVKEIDAATNEIEATKKDIEAKTKDAKNSVDELLKEFE